MRAPARLFFGSPVLIAFAICAAYVAARTVAAPQDGDLWWQYWLGETILRNGEIPRRLGEEVSSAPGAPWVAHEWLFGSALAWLQPRGLGAAALVGLIACALLAFAIASLRALALGASIVATTALGIVAVLSAAPAMGFRVQVVAWLFVSLVLAALPHPRARRLIVPATVVWANLHASAVLAPVLIALYGLGRALERRGEGRSWLALTAVASAALLATPLGLALPVYAVATLASPAGAFTAEWQRPGGLALLLAIALVAAAARAPRGVVGSGERLVTLGLFAMFAASARHAPLFVLGAGPFAAAAFPLRTPALVAATRGALALNAAASAAALVVALLTLHPVDASVPPPPAGAVAYVTALPRARVFCNDFAWCGRIVGRPGMRVFLDGRADPFPTTVWSDYGRIRFGPAWRETLDRNALDTVLVARRDALAVRLSRSREWERVYRDRDYAVYRRKPARTAS